MGTLHWYLCTFMIIISLKSSYNEKRLRQILYRKSKHNLCSGSFSGNRNVYEEMRKNMVEPNRPQVTIPRMRLACRIKMVTRKRLNITLYKSFQLCGDFPTFSPLSYWKRCILLYVIVIHIRYSISKVNVFIFVSLTYMSVSIFNSNVLTRFKCYDNFKPELVKLFLTNYIQYTFCPLKVVFCFSNDCLFMIKHNRK
jgi:hypothetical protein